VLDIYSRGLRILSLNFPKIVFCKRLGVPVYILQLHLGSFHQVRLTFVVNISQSWVSPTLRHYMNNWWSINKYRSKWGWFPAPQYLSCNYVLCTGNCPSHPSVRNYFDVQVWNVHFRTWWMVIIIPHAPFDLFSAILIGAWAFSCSCMLETLLKNYNIQRLMLPIVLHGSEAWYVDW
jgi:hypothetical protein